MINSELSRRDFLRTLTVIGTAGLLLPLVSAQADDTPGQYVPVGKTADFKEGQWRAVTLPGDNLIFVRRTGTDKPVFTALSSKCTHKGCPVVWQADSNVFFCPCHRGQFDADGKNIAGPPRRPLASLPVKVENDQVLVQA